MFGRGKRAQQASVTSTEPVRVETRATVVIEGSTPEQVWGFIRPAESAVLIQSDTIRAFTVPGTGPGVGEEQCFVSVVNGQEHIGKIKVTAEQPGGFAEAVTTNSQVPQTSRWEVEAVEGGTRLTALSVTDLPAGLTPEWLAEHREAAQQGQDSYVRRVKALLESGSVPNLP